jgi:hypothetical protein
MARSVVEVVVRFGDSVVDVAHVPPDAEYRIGTAPGVDLAVEGHTSFPLVAAGRIRCPVGLPSSEQDGRVELQLARLTLTLTPISLDVPAVARPRFDARLLRFALASLLVHVSIWLWAAVTAPFERIVEQPRPRLRHVHVEDVSEPPVPPKPAVEQAREPTAERPKLAAPRAKRKVTRTTETDVATAMPASMAAAAAMLAKSAADTHVVERVSALRPEDTYNEDDANAKGFGGSPRFPPGETIKTGPGYKLMLYDVRLCPKKSCTVTGPVPASFVRAQLHEHMDAIYDCYVQHADGPGTIVLEFTIMGDGSVRDAKGRGLGETGACAARVLPEIYFKAIGDNDVPEGKTRLTKVRYPLEFR